MKRHGRSGSALIEAAVVLPVFALMVAGTLDASRALYLGQAAMSAARAGAHRALRCDIHALDLEAIKTAAKAAAGVPELSATATRVCACSPESEVSPCDAVACGAAREGYVRVETRIEFKPYLRYPGFQSPYTIRGEAVVRLQ